MESKIKRLVIAESISVVVLTGVMWFKAITNNIFFPELNVLIPLSVIFLVLLGLGMTYDKL